MRSILAHLCYILNMVRMREHIHWLQCGQLISSLSRKQCQISRQRGWIT